MQKGTGNREMFFWLLLLGSWIALTSSAWPNVVLGTVGSAAFILLAWRSLGRLRELGMQYVCWEGATARAWLASTAAGLASAVVILAATHIAGVGVAVLASWNLLVLQVVLGPILEEVVFRGYLLTAALWIMRHLRLGLNRSATAVLVTAAAFAAMHFLAPDRKLQELLAIGITGIIYGSIRVVTGSSATCALAHAAYNCSIVLFARLG